MVMILVVVDRLAGRNFSFLENYFWAISALLDLIPRDSQLVQRKLGWHLGLPGE